LEVFHRLGGVGGDVAVELVLQREAQAVAGVLFVIDDEDGGLVVHE
jgi:hypothetical protein